MRRNQDETERSCVGYLETHPRTGTGFALTVLILSGIVLGGVVGFALTQLLAQLLGAIKAG